MTHPLVRSGYLLLMKRPYRKGSAAERPADGEDKMERPESFSTAILRVSTTWGGKKVLSRVKEHTR
jgi:hypothetical protein